MAATSALQGGFAAPAPDAARSFRAAMTAMARPGTIVRMTGAQPPAPLSPAAATLLLTLCDGETPLYLAGRFDTTEIRDWVTFHTGAPLVGAGAASFAVGDWSGLHPLDAYAIGLADYPDRSATLIVECDDLSPDGAHLSGPGIKDSATLSLPEITAFQANAARFPLGLDFFFTAGAQLAALSRTTKVRAA